MSRVFITGSSTGLGLMAAELLVSQGHQVVLHARSADRAADARRQLRQAAAVVIGDLETIAGAKGVAAEVNALGHFDAVIHNAAVGYREEHHVTADDLPHVFAINTLSAYILTALIERPKRLVYLSSGMSRDAGRMCCRTRWSPDGCQPGWVVQVRRTTWTKRTGPRFGSPPAMTRKHV